ncbi:hypothetical protein WMY93_010375 [Mugilogobius chulae]|uniref:Uncharacterized protein n=1 Tax=Mugilogobius chulae TaxID=88201 RepID=A0AAW0PIM5_9GOBI
MDSDLSVSSDASLVFERSSEVDDISVALSSDTEGGIGDSTGPEPYQFEPLAQELAAITEAAEDALQERMGPVDELCTCGHCSSLSPVENVCCRETPKVMNRCAQVGVDGCILQHPGFEAVALNPYVLQAVYGTYLQLFGEMEENAE